MEELRSAVRALISRPLYSVLAATILALGLSAGIAVFTYANGFFQPFPGVDAEGLVQIFDDSDDDLSTDISYLDFLDYAEDASGAFVDIAAARSGYAATIRHEESTDVVYFEAVSGNYFSVLDVEMSAGRSIQPADDLPSAQPVAVISYGWWQRQWNGDPSILGSVVYFNSHPHIVVGVASPRFQGSLSSFRPEAWLPAATIAPVYTSWSRRAEQREAPLVRVLGRVREAGNVALASEEIRRIAAGLDEVYPREAARPRRPTVEPATWIAPAARAEESGTVRMMLIAAGGFLVLVCANVGNLLLAMAAGRRREMALRAALGASRGRLLRQVLFESFLLAGVAGGVALLVAGPAAMSLGSNFARPSVWGWNVARQVTVDARVVLFALAASVITSVVAGMMPALAAGRRDMAGTLKSGAADGEGPPRRLGRWRVPGARDLMVSAQVALSLVLLVVAGMTLRSLSNVSDIDPGFEYQPLLASYVSTSSAGVTIPERDLWFRTLAERLGEEPWVRSATISGYSPLSYHAATGFRLEGGDEDVELTYATVIPGYFETLGMKVLRGRDFVLSDSAGAPGVAIVSQGLVERFFPGTDGVGRRVWIPEEGSAEEQAYEIVGVVNDVRVEDFLVEPEPVVYLAKMQQGYASGSALTVATTIDPAAAVPRMEAWLRDFESHIAIVNILPYAEVVRGFTYAQRMNAQIFSALAVLGLVLAAVGIFSVMTLAVTQRTREIGVRMAIGARRVEIGRLVVRRAVASVVLGLGAGLAASLELAGLVRSLLFGVGAVDPVSITAAALVFLAAALLAALLPAQRAASVDPVRSLRAD